MLRIKLLYEQNRAWIAILKYILISIIISIIVVILDTTQLEIRDNLPDIFFTSQSLAKTILSSLVGSLLTITTFTFSTILTVLSLYSSNFTPRIVSNFLKNKITMKVLGMYIGGFLYAIVTLAVMRDYDDGRKYIAGIVGVMYAIICLVYFITFVVKVTTSIQTSNVIDRLTKEALHTIEASVESTKEQKYGMYDEREIITEVEIKNTEAGYVAGIEFDRIFKILKEEKLWIKVDKKIGEYVGEGAILCRIANTQLDEETIGKLKDCFIVQLYKDVKIDYHYAITKIVEVGLRAISPGINDPNTAIQCINKIGDLLGELAKVNSNSIMTREDSEVKIDYQQIDLMWELSRNYEQIIHYGGADISVVRAIFESLRQMYLVATNKNKAIIKEFETYTYESVISNFKNQLDRKSIEKVRI